MHVHYLDPYHSRSSPIHRLDPRVKLILAAGFILTCALTSIGAWPVYILLLALVWSTAVLSELGIGYLLKRAFLAAPFVLAALPLIFTVPGQALLRLTPGEIQLVVTQPGVIRFASLALKAWISVQAAILLTATTSFPDLLAALRAVKLPKLLVATAGLMWRYLFVLVDEALRLLRARDARSSEVPLLHLKTGGRLFWRARVTGGMVGSLLLRGIERSDRIYMAMLARGYDGEVRGLPLPRLGQRQKVALVVGSIILGLLLLMGIFL